MGLGPADTKNVAILLLEQYAEPARKPSHPATLYLHTLIKNCISSDPASCPSRFARLLLAKHHDERLVQVPHSKISATARFAISFRLHLSTLGDVPIPAAE